MTSPEVRSFAFRTSTGETVRVIDCICWRHLDSRPCQTNSDRRIAEKTDVVLIPVVPSGYGSSKRSRKDTRQQNAPPTSASLLTGQQASAADSTDREALLSACAAAQSALEAAGLRAATDACPKQTPGAKYNTWENRGVALRVEVGARELASRTFSLAIHPRLGHLLPVAAAAAGEAAPVSPSGAAPTSDSGAITVGGTAGDQPPAGGSSFQPQATPANKPALRLPGLSLGSLVAGCVAVSRSATAATGARVPAADSPGAQKEPPEAAAVPAASFVVPSGGGGDGGIMTAAGRCPTGRSWCRKLHLWPEQLEAWGDTASAVAALLAELSAAAAAATGDSTPGTGAAAGDGAPGAGAGAGAAGAVVAGGAPVRPCVAHLRHLLGLGRPCHCGRGHRTLQELQVEVERRLAEEGGGQRVVAWMNPATPASHSGSPDGRQRLEQQQQRRPHRRPQRQLREAEEEEEDGGEGGEEEELGLGPGGESSAGGGRGGRVVVLLVGNIPPDVRASSVQGALAAAFAPFGFQSVGVSRTRNGGSHGWARVSLAGGDVEAAAAAAVEQLDGCLRLGGSVLTVSHSCGRLDTIFPYLPYVVRAAMRVDSTAAYSATDQATADKMTALLAGLAGRLGLGLGSMGAATSPPLGVTPGDASQGLRPQSTKPAVLQAGQTAWAGTGGPLLPALLPLTVTDGTACCGGNALSFARRFQRVVAVELDPERAADLRHNGMLVHAWAGFQRGRGQQQQQPQPHGDAARDRQATSVKRHEPGHPHPQGDYNLPAADLAAWDALPDGLDGPGPTASADGGQPPGSSTTTIRTPAVARTRDAVSGCTPPPHGWESPCPPGVRQPAGGRVEMGELEVLCGDYTRLAPILRQDIVFLDPPWGGPQYLQSAPGSAMRGPPAAASPALVDADFGGGVDGTPGSKAPGAGAPPRPRKMELGDTAFMLGSTPLSYLISDLLATGAAGMVAVKLPSRADAELRAMQARVRQLLSAARLSGPAGGLDGCEQEHRLGGEDGGEGAAAVGGADDDEEEEGEGEEEEGYDGDGSLRETEARRLLGAEITLGRSALVVFILRSQSRCGNGQGSGGGGGGGGGEEEARISAEGGPMTSSPAIGGQAAGSEGHRTGEDNGGVHEEGAAGVGRPGGAEGNEEATGGNDHGPLHGVAGNGVSGGRTQVNARTKGQPGSGFRAVLRDCCSSLGLPYRVVCD